MSGRARNNVGNQEKSGINHDKARIVLDRAFADTSVLVHANTDQLESVGSILKSNHLTYKYVLITALLGRSSADINPLVLQKSSKLSKPWDARSLCHKVVVPFEQTTLDGRLGASNEPFLNKPARYTDISLNNAVRRGSDREVLETLYALLKGRVRYFV